MKFNYKRTCRHQCGGGEKRELNIQTDRAARNVSSITYSDLVEQQRREKKISQGSMDLKYSRKGGFRIKKKKNNL